MNYTCSDFDRDIESLIKQIKPHAEKYDYIVGIARGGLIPAVYLSHALGLPMRTVTWSTFHNHQVKEHALDIADDVLSGKKVLIVDDILDSGETFRELMADWEIALDMVDVAVLIYNNQQSTIPTYHGWEIDRSVITDWIVFPWESTCSEEN
jgi:hypoxanthine phosphoribosyltransferase